MRLKENFFWDDSLLILEGMPDGYKYSNILLKMYLRSLKFDGRLVVNNAIPYDVNMLASVTGHDESTIRCALDAFKALGLIEVLDNGAIYMLNIQNFIGESSTEADRVREYRANIAAEKAKCTNLVQMYDERTPEIEIKKEIEKEIKKEQELNIDTKVSVNKVDYQMFANQFNSICISLPKVTKLTDKRKKAIKSRLKTFSEEEIIRAFEMVEESDFCSGRSGSWQASFDWLFTNDSNITKVLEGNYKNKGSVAAESADDARQRFYDEWKDV